MHHALNFIRNLLDISNLDAVALVPGANFKTVFGYDFFLMERPLVVIVPRQGKEVAIVPDLEMPAFMTLNFEGPVFSWQDHSGYQEAFDKAAKVLPQLAGSQRVGLEAMSMRVFEQMALQQAFDGVQFVNAHHMISQVRIRKTHDDIKILKKAIEISEQALTALLPQIQVGQSEQEVKEKLIQLLYMAGAETLSFDPIVATGGNSAHPHAMTHSDVYIQRGDALLIDFGARYGGFNADITRTFFVGEVSDYNRKFYNTVLEANQLGCAIAQVGMSAHELDERTTAILKGSEFSDYIVHKTGHGLGRELHEAPHIMHGNHEILEEGMVFTIEPGLYKKDHLGVRIEDDVILRQGGPECLTNFSKELTVIG